MWQKENMSKQLIIIFLWGMVARDVGTLAANSTGPVVELFCQSDVEIGKPLAMRSLLLLDTADTPVEIVRVLWIRKDSTTGREENWFMCEEGQCRQLVSQDLFENTLGMELTERDGSFIVWQSDLRFLPAKAELGGTWIVRWQLPPADISHEYACDVAVLPATSNLKPPIPQLIKFSRTEHSINVTYTVADSVRSFSQLIDDGVVQYFLLQVYDRGSNPPIALNVYREATLGKLDNGTAVLSYQVSDLRPSTLYDIRLIAVGLETNSSSRLVSFMTLDDAPAMCPQETDDRGIVWKESPAGRTTTQQCPTGYSGVVTRKCLPSGFWAESNDIDCRKDQLTEIEEQISTINQEGKQPTQQQIAQISESLDQNVGQPDQMYAGEIVQTVDILDQVAKAVDTTHQENLVDSSALENFASAADKVLSTDDSKWKRTTVETSGTDYGSKLMLAVDKIATSSLNDPGLSNDPIVKTNIAVKRDSASMGDIVFPEAGDKAYDKYDGWVANSGNKLLLSATNFDDDQEPDSIQYAIVLFNGVDTKFVVNPEAQNRHRSGREFSGLEVSTDVMSFSLSKSMGEFRSPLNLEFEIRKVNNSNPVCAYLDTSLGAQPIWSSEGCTTTEREEGVVVCQCNHLTNFAVLMSPFNTDQDSKHHDILSIVTYAGCGISILCLIITIVVHAITWKYVSENRTVLHMNLSVVLILAYAVFLAGIDRTEYDTICTVAAALLHFLFLAVFFLMLVEGFQIFVSVTFVFSTDFRLKLLLFLAYLFPAAIVGVTYYLMGTDDYRHSEFCWLNVDSKAVWAFVGPALFVILVNFIIIGVTLRAMMTTVTMKEKGAKDKAKSALRAICVMSPIFGITWVFGVLAFNDSLVVFQYLFAVFNTLQGFFVFLFYCLLSNQIKDGFRHMLRKHRSRSFGTEDQMFSSNKSTTKSRKMSDSSHNTSASGSDSRVMTPVTEKTDAGSPFSFVNPAARFDK